MDTEAYINQQLGRKLLEYNEDLKQKEGRSCLERFSLFAIICVIILITLQLIRCKG